MYLFVCLFEGLCTQSLRPENMLASAKWTRSIFSHLIFLKMHFNIILTFLLVYYRSSFTFRLPRKKKLARIPHNAHAFCMSHTSHCHGFGHIVRWWKVQMLKLIMQFPVTFSPTGPSVFLVSLWWKTGIQLSCFVLFFLYVFYSATLYVDLWWQ